MRHTAGVAQRTPGTDEPVRIRSNVQTGVWAARCLLFAVLGLLLGILAGRGLRPVEVVPVIVVLAVVVVRGLATVVVFSSERVRVRNALWSRTVPTTDIAAIVAATRPAFLGLLFGRGLERAKYMALRLTNGRTLKMEATRASAIPFKRQATPETFLRHEQIRLWAKANKVRFQVDPAHYWR